MNRFNVSSTQRHIHNNIDSPYVFQPILTYIGLINEDGSAAVLPNGWSSVRAGGIYTITHNIESKTGLINASFGAPYSIVTQCQGDGILSSFVQEGLQVFTVEWKNPAGVVFDTAFSFILTVVNNKSQQLPTYGGDLIT